MSNYIRLFFAFCCAPLLFVGCGGEKLPPDMPRLFPTTVTIVQEGIPLEGATVVLHPKDPNSRWSAAGLTDASGKVEFFTHGRYRGVPEGEYQLTVCKIYSEQSQYQEPPAGMDERTFNNLRAAENLGVYRLVDPIYDNPTTSPLEISVGRNQPQDRQFDVGKAIKEFLPIDREPTAPSLSN